MAEPGLPTTYAHVLRLPQPVGPIAARVPMAPARLSPGAHRVGNIQFWLGGVQPTTWHDDTFVLTAPVFWSCVDRLSEVSPELKLCPAGVAVAGGHQSVLPLVCPRYDADGVDHSSRRRPTLKSR